MFLEKLRVETKAVHDSLEQKEINKKLFSKEANIDDYIKFLKLQYGVWVEIEKELMLLTPEFKKKDIEFFSRTEDIKKELTSLNNSLPKQNMKTKKINDFKEALVFLYLLEGSRHGGMVIINQIKRFMPNEYEYIFLNTPMDKFLKNWKMILKAINENYDNEIDQKDFINEVSFLYKQIGVFYDKFTTTNPM